MITIRVLLFPNRIISKYKVHETRTDKYVNVSVNTHRLYKLGKIAFNVAVKCSTYVMGFLVHSLNK